MKTSTMTPWIRRVMQVGIYEAIAIAAVTIGFHAFTDKGVSTSAAYAVSTSVFAVIWNYIYNTLFESWESRQTQKGRSLRRRIAHAIGFEIGFIATLVPLMAWWFSLNLIDAFITQIGLMVFFMIYTFVFNWAFDHIVGLPQSAVAQHAENQQEKDDAKLMMTR